MPLAYFRYLVASKGSLLLGCTGSEMSQKTVGSFQRPSQHVKGCHKPKGAVGVVGLLRASLFLFMPSPCWSQCPGSGEGSSAAEQQAKAGNN